ncbi:M16 family metallopeptidase [Solilutibacter pythonis]|nr:pitrilysin family protein [Lysobacter pythonis]
MNLFRSSPLARGLFAAALLVAACAAQAAGMAERVQRTSVAGIDVIVYPMPVKDVVSVVGTMPLGDAQAAAKAANPAVPMLTAMLLEAGTRKRDKETISSLLTARGASVNWQPQARYLGFSARALRKDLDVVVGVVAEELREPAFSPEEFARARARMQAAEKEKRESTGARAFDALSSAVFSPDHPNAPVASERMLQALASATVDEVKAFHRANYGGRHMSIVFAGDIDLKSASAMVERAFAGWGGGHDFVRTSASAKTPSVYDIPIAMADKASATTVLGQATGLSQADPDYLPLAMGINVLGTGITGRLMSAVRVKEGLTYGIDAGHYGDDLADGLFAIDATFAPALLDRGVSSTRRELERWWKDGITAEELSARKSSMVGGYQNSLATTRGMAFMLAQTIRRGQPLDWMDAYPERIRALTLAQVNAAIRKHIDPKKMVLVKAGTLADPKH